MIPLNSGSPRPHLSHIALCLAVCWGKKPEHSAFLFIQLYSLLLLYSRILLSVNTKR